VVNPDFSVGIPRLQSGISVYLVVYMICFSQTNTDEGKHLI